MKIASIKIDMSPIPSKFNELEGYGSYNDLRYI